MIDPRLPCSPALSHRGAMHVTLGVCVALGVLLTVAYAGYRYGVHSGYRRGQEYERSLFTEAPNSGLPPSVAATPERKFADSAASAVPVAIDAQEARDTWCFSASECARLVWPMEFLTKSDAWPQPHFRVRQGVNRLSQPGKGLCEFAFALKAPAQVIIYAHLRYSDECGNSLNCQIDGGRAAPLGKKNIYDHWLWDSTHGRFNLSAGLHRLTLATRADGLEFDRVVVATKAMPDAELNALEITPAPTFDMMPVASQNLPIVDGVTACAMADHSVVIGKGHRNSLTVVVRLNRSELADGEIHVKELIQGQASELYVEPFSLSPQQRSLSFSRDLVLRKLETYLHPVRVDVFVKGRCVHSQQLDFIHPFSWAFLGPFDDPGEKGLYLQLEADKRIGELPDRPQIAGANWKVVEDGSCYDDFGVVDLNKVYGRTNERWSDNATRMPAVAYAVTCIRCPPSHHLLMAFAGDDGLRGWLNGQPLLQQNTQTPLETTRIVLGVNVEDGTNRFVFKISQTTLYWQLLFEPDASVPYSHANSVYTCPVWMWK